MDPEIRQENVETLLDKKFLRVYDLKYAPGKHYFNASRRPLEELACVKDDDAFRRMTPDAASCVVVLRVAGEEDRLLLTREYRYPAGRILLGIPAGLVDPEDRDAAEPAIETAKREIREETGLTVKDTDRVFVINPLLFSSPGMTDESNALVCAVLDLQDLSGLSNGGQTGAEQITDFVTITREEAQKLLRDGRDDRGYYYSVYTWASLMTFVTGMYQ